MIRFAAISTACLLLFTSAALTVAQDAPPAAPAAKTPPPAAPAPKAPEKKEPDVPMDKKLAVTINGHKIMEKEVFDMFSGELARRSPAGMTDEQKKEMYRNYRARFLSNLIDSRLIEDKAKEAGVEVTEEELAKAAEKNLQDFLKARSMTYDQLQQQMQKVNKKSVEQILVDELSNPAFVRAVLQAKLAKELYPDDFNVTDEDVRKHYTTNLERTYKIAEQVKASHILFKFNRGATDEEKAVVRQKAQDVLNAVKKPEANFAAFAKEHSQCPSNQRGGDLGFFPRTGKMVEPFAAAAFALKVGDISDLVETQFGYHIIKVTDKKPAETKTLDSVKDSIRQQLTQNKERSAVMKCLDELKKAAKIEYPEGAEPVPPQKKSPMTVRSSTKPSAIKPRQAPQPKPRIAGPDGEAQPPKTKPAE